MGEGVDSEGGGWLCVVGDGDGGDAVDLGMIRLWLRGMFWDGSYGCFAGFGDGLRLGDGGGGLEVVSFVQSRLRSRSYKSLSGGFFSYCHGRLYLVSMCVCRV